MLPWMRQRVLLKRIWHHCFKSTRRRNSALTRSGIGDDQFNASLDNFATNLQNAKFSANDLTRAFQANAVAINDANGKQKDTNKLLDAAIDIVQRQKTVQDAIQVGGFFGFSKTFLNQ